VRLNLRVQLEVPRHVCRQDRLHDRLAHCLLLVAAQLRQDVALGLVENAVRHGGVVILEHTDVVVPAQSSLSARNFSQARVPHAACHPAGQICADIVPAECPHSAYLVHSLGVPRPQERHRQPRAQQAGRTSGLVRIWS